MTSHTTVKHEGEYTCHFFVIHTDHSPTVSHLSYYQTQLGSSYNLQIKGKKVVPGMKKKKKIRCFLILLTWGSSKPLFLYCDLYVYNKLLYEEHIIKVNLLMSLMKTRKFTKTSVTSWQGSTNMEMKEMQSRVQWFRYNVQLCSYPALAMLTIYFLYINLPLAFWKVKYFYLQQFMVCYYKGCCMFH